jgi:hypothetical protein
VQCRLCGMAMHILQHSGLVKRKGEEKYESEINQLNYRSGADSVGGGG